MKQRLIAGAMTAALLLGCAAPALADGSAVFRNLVIFGYGIGTVVTNYNHKVREKRAEQKIVVRRQEAYREWFYHKFGYYPTQEQFKKWYLQTYGNATSTSTKTTTTTGTTPAAPGNNQR